LIDFKDSNLMAWAFEQMYRQIRNNIDDAYLLQFFKGTRGLNGKYYKYKRLHIKE